ncbi:MAG TPA: DMT family transporter [Trebonia sp.]|nr:DMT family transporter [Trebonia sp.]
MQSYESPRTGVLSALQVRRGGARLVDLGLLGVALAWGSSYLAAKIATGLGPVPVVLLGRYALSAVACVLIAGLASRTTGRPLVTRAELKAGVLLGTTQAAVLVLETWGVAGTSAANAGVLISFTIILTPIIEASLGGSLPRRFFLAAGVSVAGIAVLTGAGGLTGLRAGDLLVLAAALVRAGNVVLIGRLSARSREHDRDRDRAQLRPLNLTMAQMVVGTACTLPLAVPDLTRAPHALGSPEFWAVVAFLALGCSVFAFLVQTWGVQQTSASRASLLLGTEPVWAVLVALTVGGEHLTAVALTGCLLILASCWWGQSIEAAHRRRSEGMRAVTDAAFLSAERPVAPAPVPPSSRPEGQPRRTHGSARY